MLWHLSPRSKNDHISPALRMHNKYIALHPTGHHRTNIRLLPMLLAHPKVHQLVPRIAKHHRSASQQSTPQHTTIHYLKASIIFVVTSFKFISNIQTLWVNSTQWSLPISLKLNQSLFQCPQTQSVFVPMMSQKHREEPDIGAVVAGWVQCNILVMHSQSWGYMVVVATGAEVP